MHYLPFGARLNKGILMVTQLNKAFSRFLDYSHSTNPNQFCLEIILCRIRGTFDYLIYPYYPAHMG